MRVARRITASAFLLLCAGLPARADLTINATFDSSITGLAGASQIEASINAAISNVTSSITSPNHLTVSIDFQNMSTGLGQSNTTAYSVSYFDYYNALKVAATSPTQLAALASLGTPPTNENSVNPVNGSTQIIITSAEGRNLGFNTPGASGPGGTNDGVIGLNTSITSPPNGLNSNTYSLQSVATHEIDEILGIGGTGSNLGSTGGVGDLDLFRYSAPGVRGYSTNPNATAYFSINGGTTVLSFFNQVAGADYGDWKSDPLPAGFGPQVQDAFATPGSAPTLGVNELTAFNVIGYGLVPSSVPEPASVLMVGVGLALTVWTFRTRKPAKTPAPV